MYDLNHQLRQQFGRNRDGYEGYVEHKPKVAVWRVFALARAANMQPLQA